MAYGAGSRVHASRPPLNGGAEGFGRQATPFNWAASSDDVDVAEALIDGGADIEAPGGSIAGAAHWTTPLGTHAGAWRACSFSAAPAWTRYGTPQLSAC